MSSVNGWTHTHTFAQKPHLPPYKSMCLQVKYYLWVQLIYFLCLFLSNINVVARKKRKKRIHDWLRFYLSCSCWGMRLYALSVKSMFTFFLNKPKLIKFCIKPFWISVNKFFNFFGRTFYWFRKIYLVNVRRDFCWFNKS